MSYAMHAGFALASDEHTEPSTAVKKYGSESPKVAPEWGVALNSTSVSSTSPVILLYVTVVSAIVPSSSSKKHWYALPHTTCSVRGSARHGSSAGTTSRQLLCLHKSRFSGEKPMRVRFTTRSASRRYRMPLPHASAAA